MVQKKFAYVYRCGGSRETLPWDQVKARTSESYKVNARTESEITVQVNILNCEVALYKILFQLRSVEGIINW